MEVLKKASVTNSKNIIHQVLGLQTDFSEALSNYTRKIIQPGNTFKFVCIILCIMYLILFL